MSDMSYDTDGLREGARGDRRSADGAQRTESTLRSGSITAAAFGNVGNAAAFAGQTSNVQRTRADDARRAVEHREDQGRRAGSAATQGDGLVTETTSVAQSAPSTPTQLPR